MNKITEQIHHLEEIIHMLELRLKTCSNESRVVFEKVIDDLRESVSLLESQISSGREADESFWTQHQERIDHAWHDVITRVLDDVGDSRISTTREMPQ